MIYTDCDNCIFNRSKTDQFGQTEQIGCHANRLKTFEDRGRSQFCYNQDTKSGYYRISGVCNLKTVAKPPEQSLDDALAYARFNADNIFDVIIYTTERNYKELDKTIESINQQDMVHKTRIAINGTPLKINKSKLKNYIVHNFLERSSLWDTLDNAVAQIKDHHLYYCYVPAGAVLPQNLFKDVAYYLNELLLPVSVVYDRRFIIMNVRTHRILGGSDTFKITAKLRDLYNNEDNRKFILSYDEIKSRINGTP